MYVIFPKKDMGVDIEHGYEPHYITVRGKGKTVSALKKAIKKADKVYLAMDPDREGEAIGWHVLEVADLLDKSGMLKKDKGEFVDRVVFSRDLLKRR